MSEAVHKRLKMDFHALQHFWERRSPWMQWWLVTVAALGVCVMAFAWQHSVAGRRAALELEAVQAAAAAASAAEVARAPVFPSKNWVNELPRTIQPLPLVQALQRASREAGVALVSMQLREQTAAEDKLGRLEVAAMLRGNYAAIKQALGDALAPFPSATVRSLQWRATEEVALAGPTASARPGMSAAGQGTQATATPATELSVVVSVWTAPLGMGQPMPDQTR